MNDSAQPAFYFNVNIAIQWESLGTHFKERSSPDQLRVNLIEMVGERHPNRTRGSLLYTLSTTDVQEVQSTFLSRIQPYFQVPLQDGDRGICLVMEETGLCAIGGDRYEEAARRYLARLDIWKTMDLLSLVESGRHCLPAPKKEVSPTFGGYTRRAEFEPMPCAPDFELGAWVNLARHAAATEFTLTNVNVIVRFEIEPHLEGSAGCAPCDPITRAIEASRTV
jgi:hypothetical protein